MKCSARAAKRKEAPENSSSMTGADMKRWMDVRHMTTAQLARLIDVHYDTVHRMVLKSDSEVPKVYRLALAALAGGILDYDGAASIGPPGFVTMLEPEHEEKVDG